MQSGTLLHCLGITYFLHSLVLLFILFKTKGLLLFNLFILLFIFSFGKRLILLFGKRLILLFIVNYHN